MLLPNPYNVPDAPATISDSGSYEFYASQAPGATRWTAVWIHPSRDVTLTPSRNPTQPSALSLLLRSEANGLLNLWFATNFPRVTFNGGPVYQGYAIGGGPDGHNIHYSMGVTFAKPTDAVGDLDLVAGADPSIARRRLIHVPRR